MVEQAGIGAQDQAVVTIRGGIDPERIELRGWAECAPIRAIIDRQGRLRLIPNEPSNLRFIYLPSAILLGR